MADVPVFIPLGVGMETDIAEQLLQPGSSPLVENAVGNQRGQWIRRAGATQLAAAGGAACWRLETLGGGAVRFNEAPEPVKVYDPTSATFIAGGNGNMPAVISYRKGPTKVDTHTAMAEVPAGEQVSSPSIAVGNGYAVVAYERTNGAAGTQFSEHLIIELQSGRIVYRRTLGASTRRPRLMVVGTRCAVAYDNNGTLTIDVYNLATLSLSGSQAIGGCQAGTHISIRSGALTAGTNRVSVLYQESAAGILTVADADVTNLAGFTTYQAKTALGGTVVPDLEFRWMQDFGASGKFSVIIADTVSGLRVLWALQAPSAGASNATATHVLDNTATAAPVTSTAGIRNVIGTTTSSSATGLYRVLYEVTAPDLPTRGSIKTAVWSGSATLATLYRGVGIRSELWANDTSFYFWAAFAGTDQKSYFALAMSNDLTVSSSTFPAPQAVAFPRGAGGLTEKIGHPTQIATGPNGELYAAVTKETRTESVASGGTAIGGTAGVLSIEILELTHRTAGDTELGRAVEFLGGLFVPGGVIGYFDGHTYGMPGFAWYPPSSGVASSAGGNLTPSANYLYRFCYSFIDANGRKWRSAPSTPIPAATTGTDFQFTLTIETLRLWDRGLPDGSEGYQIEAYRTQASETDAFFLVASVQNDPNSTQITLVDNVADTALGEELYTDGGGLENQLLPGARCVEVFQNRLVMANEGTLWYSLDIGPNGQGLLFNEALTLDVADPHDPITGISANDTVLPTLKHDRVFIVSGQGGDSQGNGATLEPRLIETGIGCTETTSITATPDGAVWFKSSSSRAGIHRINGLAVEYVGQGVRAYNNLPVVAAVSVPDRSEVRFYTLSGRTLVRNLVTGGWSTNTGQPCRSAAIGYAGAAGVIYAHTSGTILADGVDGVDFADNGAAVVLKVRSPWLTIGEVEGWERVKRAQGAGIPGGAHVLTAILYRDFDETDIIGQLSKTFTGTESKWTWEIRPKVQKLSALMIELQVVSATAQGPAISGVTLIAGLQDGLKKLPASMRMAPA